MVAQRFKEGALLLPGCHDDMPQLVLRILENWIAGHICLEHSMELVHHCASLTATPRCSGCGGMLTCNSIVCAHVLPHTQSRPSLTLTAWLHSPGGASLSSGGNKLNRSEGSTAPFPEPACCMGVSPSPPRPLPSPAAMQRAAIKTEVEAGHNKGTTGHGRAKKAKVVCRHGAAKQLLLRFT